MAVHQPGTRVVSRVGDDKPAAGREVDDVTTRWVVESELRQMRGYIESTRALSENITVMAVKVDWMSNRRGVGSLLDDPVCPLWIVRSIPELNVHGLRTAAVGATDTTLYSGGKLLLFSATYLSVGFPGSIIMDVPLTVHKTKFWPFEATGPNPTGRLRA